MSGAIEKKKNDTLAELESSPATHIAARSAILSDIALSREFSNVYLQALCKKFTSSSGSYSLSQICENLAEQRAICYGASSLKTSYGKFDLPTYESVNGALTLTEANTSFFGYVATDLAETNTITLSNDTTAEQTIDGNTFSTYVGNYYMVRSRVSGELEPFSANMSAYTTPNGDDVLFGNAIAWGSSVEGEQEANTWNYHWAKANVASVAIKNENGILELNTLTLADNLTQGSNTDYTPLGPAFGQKFYLKRHADAVETFTITGTTTIDSPAITDVSEADLAKVKHGDVISGLGIPDNVTILAVQTEKSTIRLSETGIATADGTVTLTVNSVSIGHAAHDIFCQIEISGEGLVANTSWTPVGDYAGNYATGSEDDLCVANTTEFINLLNFFDPNNTAAGKDLIKGASASYVSDGKEVSTTSYPYIKVNPFFPSTAGTTKEYTTKTEGNKTIITGTQPSGLGDKDIWTGRYTRWDNDREDASGIVDEYRYMIDSAEKFYYELPAGGTFTCGTQTVPSAHPMPNPNEPPKELANKTALQLAVAAVLSGSTNISVGNNTPVIPADDDIEYVSNGTTAAATSSSDVGNFYQLHANNVIQKMYVKKQITAGNSTFHEVSYSNEHVSNFQCVYNYVQGHLYHGASTANSDVAATELALTNLQAIDSFRDPIIGFSGVEADGGISDEIFDTTVATAADGTLTTLRAMQASFRTAFNNSNRVTHPTGNPQASTSTPTGDPVDYRAFTHSSSTVNAWATWTTFSNSWENLKTAITGRIAEIDARIGVPTRSGAPASARLNPPAVYVSAIPSSNTTGGLVPYGRSIYNACNHLLGRDVNLLGGIIGDVESLTDLIDMVKTARNKYEIYSGRDKKY